MTDRPPNILFIMGDDHAANAIGCYGSRLAGLDPTPNIDRLAAQGARLDGVSCTNALCTPSRATILTGQYSHVNGVKTIVDSLEPAVPHLGAWLQEAGYQTAVIGKWHLFAEPSGFDDWQYLSGALQQGTYFDPEFATRHDGTVQDTGYVSDRITDRCLDWLRRRDRDRPFLLLCHHKAPHDFWEFPERHAERFVDREILAPSTLFEDKSHRSEGSRMFGSSVSPGNPWRSLADVFSQEDYITGPLKTSGMDHEQATRAAYRKYLEDYLRCAATVDDSVGELLAFLDDEGIAEQTVVIYTSDQGMLLGEHDHGDKRWMFQESLQMPFVVRYPPEIAPGTVNDDLITNVDVCPTLLDHADVAVPDTVQGRSFRANLAGATPPDWPEAVYYRYWMHMDIHGVPAHYGVRTKRYKLLFFYGLGLDVSGSDYPPTPAGWELYDTDLDPDESRNVYDDPAYGDVVAELTEELDRLKQLVGDTDDAYPEVRARRRELGAGGPGIAGS